MLSQLTTNRIKHTTSTLISILIIIASVPVFSVAYNEVSARLGLRKVPVPVVGTGSMYPSLYWDKSEGGPDDASETTLLEERTTPLMYSYVPDIDIGRYSFGLRDIERGDVVAFQNDQTASILAAENENIDSGFVKRVIAVEGDTVEFRDGFVILNDKPLDEPYIYRPRSTYGGTSIPDCQSVTVPEHKLLVLGDNRKLSDDSRFELGLIDESDVTFVLPYSEQKIYETLWRDTAKDDELANTPSLNRQELYGLINSKRKDSGISELSISTNLERSSYLRAESILRSNDFSIEATKSGYTAKRAMQDAGYSNIITGEILSHGYYTADELFQNISYFHTTSSQILSDDYQEIGFSVVNSEVNGCPTQAIVGHLGGYIPAEYDEEVVNSWKTLYDNLVSAIPSWENAKNSPNIDQEDLSEILTLLYKRRDLASEIYDTMVSQRWLTEDQKRRIEEDESDSQKLNTLINEINN